MNNKLKELLYDISREQNEYIVEDLILDYSIITYIQHLPIKNDGTDFLIITVGDAMDDSDIMRKVSEVFLKMKIKIAGCLIVKSNVEFENNR